MTLIAQERLPEAMIIELFPEIFVEALPLIFRWLIFLALPEKQVLAFFCHNVHSQHGYVGLNSCNIHTIPYISDSLANNRADRKQFSVLSNSKFVCKGLATLAFLVWFLRASIDKPPCSGCLGTMVKAMLTKGA